MATDNTEYQPSQQIQAGSMRDIGGSMANLAESNNWLGQLGARATMNGSVSIMKALGYEAGLNPNGDALPAITKADEAYVNAYNQQSQMTLSSQANELRMQAQTELSRAYKLTPELIMEYEDTVGSGMEQILAIAPREVGQELRFKMANAMTNDSAKLNQKLIAQSHQDSFDLWKYSKAQDLREIFETGLSGDTDVAHALYEKHVEDNAVNRSTGLINAQQERAANDAARQTYLSSKYTGLAMQARSEGREAEFMADLGTNKPRELTFAEWPSVAQSVASYTANLDKMQSEQRQVKSSEYLLKLTENPLAVTDTDLSELEGILTPVQMNQLAAKTIVAQRAAMKAMEKQRVDIAGFNNVDSFSRMSNKEKDSAFHALVDRAMQQAKDNGDALDPFDAEMLIVATAAGEVPAFSKKLISRFKTGDATQVSQAAVAFERIYRINNKPYNVNSVANDTEAMAIMDLFKANTSGGMQPDLALEAARQSVKGKSPERITYLEKSYGDYIKSKRNQGETAAGTAMRVLGYGNSTPVSNPSALGYRLDKMMQANWIATDGDPQATIEMTQRTVSRSYGLSEFNGREEVTYMPLEKTTGIPSDAKGIIQQDAYRQMRVQLQDMKAQYDKGNIDYWIEVPETRDIASMIKLSQSPEYKKYMNSKSIKGIAIPEAVEAARKDIKEFIKGGDMQVTRHHRKGGTDILNIGIVAQDTLQVVNGSDTIGGYEVVEKTPLGFRSLSISNGLERVIVYAPSASQLQQDYAALLSAAGNETAREVYERQLESRKEEGFRPRMDFPSWMQQGRKAAAGILSNRRGGTNE